VSGKLVKVILFVTLSVLGLGLAVHLWLRARSAAALSELQRLALEVLQKAHPDWILAPSGPNGIDVRAHGKGSHLYLDNVLREAGDDRARAAQLIAQSGRTLAAQLEAAARPETFDSVKARLRPALVPRDYAERFGMASRGFVGDLLEVLVVDDPSSIRYVLGKDLSAWQVPLDGAASVARANLWQESRSLPLAAQGPDNPTLSGKFVTLATRDGYDAARLVLPELRGALAERLGYPYYAAIPNRDFLIAWSNDYAFAAQFSEKVRADFAQRSYPISGKTYRVQPGFVQEISSADASRSDASHLH
jgi:hypothetical protein